MIKGRFEPVAVADVKKNAKSYKHMTKTAKAVLDIVKERNEETDAPLRDQMQAWDIAFDDSGMPVMAVPTMHSNSLIGYLSPIGAYRFQVSISFDGKVNIGSTDIMNLRKYANDEDYKVLCSLAKLAIFNGGHMKHLTVKESGKVGAFTSLCISYLNQIKPKKSK